MVRKEAKETGSADRKITSVWWSVLFSFIPFCCISVSHNRRWKFENKWGFWTTFQLVGCPEDHWSYYGKRTTIKCNFVITQLLFVGCLITFLMCNFLFLCTDSEYSGIWPPNGAYYMLISSSITKNSAGRGGVFPQIKGKIPLKSHIDLIDYQINKKSKLQKWWGRFFLAGICFCKEMFHPLFKKKFQLPGARFYPGSMRLLFFFMPDGFMVFRQKAKKQKKKAVK